MSLKKEVVEIINEEESCLAQTYDSLLQQRDKSAKKLTVENRRARELTSGLVATRRAEDKVQLASDEAISHALKDLKSEEIEKIDQLLLKPYFARIVLEEENGPKKNIEYKIGYSANPDCRIIDWRRAPLSKLYYEYQEGEEYCEDIQGRERWGIVQKRHTLDIDKNNLRRISCRHGSFARDNGDWKQLSQGFRSRVEGEAGELPNILALITPQQFKTITEDARTAVLIQGIAGSGKTTVALHRLAWLMHKDNSDLEPEKCIVLVYNNVLKEYVSRTLPSMEVGGIEVMSFADWGLKLVKRCYPNKQYALNPGREAASVSRLKRSQALLDSLELLVFEQTRSLISKLDQGIDWQAIPSGFNSLFERFKSKFEKSGLADLRPIEFLNDLKASIGKMLGSLNHTHPKFSGLKGAEAIILEQLTHLDNQEKDLIDLFSYPQKILELDRTKLLDKELIDKARQDLCDNLEQGILELSDLALLLRLTQLKKGALPISKQDWGHYHHIVLDEIQDFSVVDLTTIVSAVKSPSDLTLVGDVAQQLNAQNDFPGWEIIKNNWGLSEESSHFITLNVSHRSTIQIMKLADYVYGEERTQSGREGKKPIWFKLKNERYAVEHTLKWLSKGRERYPSSLTAVICRDRQQAKYVYSLLEPSFGPAVRLGDNQSFSFDSGIVVTPVESVKGLEFHSVLVWNPSAASYPDNQHSRHLLYIALTRAESYLSLFTWQKPAAALPLPQRGLVRWYDYSLDEETN